MYIFKSKRLVINPLKKERFNKLGIVSFICVISDPFNLRSVFGVICAPDQRGFNIVILVPTL